MDRIERDDSSWGHRTARTDCGGRCARHRKRAVDDRRWRRARTRPAIDYRREPAMELSSTDYAGVAPPARATEKHTQGTSSTLMPAARQLRITLTGTRVPRTTACPCATSGARSMSESRSAVIRLVSVRCFAAHHDYVAGTVRRATSDTLVSADTRGARSVVSLAVRDTDQ